MLISKFRASALMLALMFSVFATGQTTQWRDIHKVKKGETLFGLAKSYAISIQDLIDANPEMKTPGYELKKGDWVFVPFAKKDDVPASSLQQVQPKQTPPAGSQQPQTVKPAVQAQSAATTARKADGTVRVGVMLPLHNENGDGKRMVEYYRGILMALNKLSEEGIRTEVKAWNVPIDALGTCPSMPTSVQLYRRKVWLTSTLLSVLCTRTWCVRWQISARPTT